MLRRVSEIGAVGAGASIGPARRKAVWSLGFIAAIVVLLQAYLIAGSYQRYVAESEKLTAAIARVVEDLTQRSLQGALLLLAATESEMGAAKLALNHQAARNRLHSVPEIRGIYLVGPDGRVRDSTLSGADLGFDASEHDYIVQMIHSGGPGFAIGRPILRRSLSAPENAAHAFLPLALRLPGKAGFLVAAINLSYLELQYRPLFESNAAAVTLVRFDGTVLLDAARSWTPGAYVAAHDPIFRSYLPGREHATFAREPVLGKGAQIVSFRVTRGFPVVVSVAINRSSVWGDWLEASLPTLLAMPIAMMLVLVAILQLARKLKVIARQEKSLRESRDAAEAANKAKSQFLAVMSHEIRTPMNAVLGMASTLMEEDLKPEQHACAKSIYEAGDALLVILNDILDYTRFEWGMLALESAPFRPRSLLEQCVKVVESSAASKGLAVAVEAEGDNPFLLGDPGRIKQVVLNLLTNAIKFTPTGTISVRLQLAEAADGRVQLECSVRDTGIGIPADRIDDLFKEFVQADASINRRFGGSGLGLAICKRIIERMGGSIWVNSRLGEGTTFSFSLALPKAEDQTESGALNEPTQDLSEAIGRLGRPFRLLVVDDNATNHLVADKMLRGVPIDIHKAYDGTQAVVLAGGESFDAILMDMRMPEMDGIAAARAIRSGGGPNAKTPIIAFTANAFPEDEALCREAGMNDMVAKPVRKPRLITALLKTLGGEGAVPGYEKTVIETKPPTAVVAPAAEAAPQPAPRKDAPGAHEITLFDPKPYRALEREIGAEAMAETIEIFVSETDARLSRMLELNPVTDQETIRREAHSLKGDGRSFGFLEMGRIAAELEMESKSGPPVGYTESIERLAQIWRVSRVQLPTPGERTAA